MNLLIAAMLIAAGPSEACVAASHRFTAFLIEEAKGTRHEAQINASIANAGGLDKLVVKAAAAMEEEKCAFLLAAPDSTVRALAISALPERAGK